MDPGGDISECKLHRITAHNCRNNFHLCDTGKPGWTAIHWKSKTFENVIPAMIGPS